jgi:hypothetical protein
MLSNNFCGFFRRCIILLLFAITLGISQNVQGLRSVQPTSQRQLSFNQDVKRDSIGRNKKKQVSIKKSGLRKNAKVTLRVLPPADTGRILARIGGKTILVDEFIRRAEYTVRPSYCKGDGGFDMKIILNSLLAEKMLAFEAGKDNELMKSESFQRMVQGLKEQLMRNVIYYAEGTSKAQVDTARIKRECEIAGRTYHIEFFSIPNDSAATVVKQILDTSAASFADIYHALTGRDSLPQRDVNWISKESQEVRKALFKDRPAVNQVVGPVQVNDESYLFIRVKGWTDHVAVTEKQISDRWNDVNQELTHEQADERYDNYIISLMQGKRLQLEPHTFMKFIEIVAPYYLESKKEKEKTVLDEMYQRQPQEHPEFDDIERNLNPLQGAPLFTIDGKVWTVEDVAKEMERHPLVFRNKNLHKKNFAKQLKLALVDMVRDRYLTQEAYSRGFDRYPMVTHYTDMWQDATLSLWQKDAYLKSNGVDDNDQIDIITKYLDPYVDSLRRKYSDCIEFNVNEFNNIQLTGIPMFVLEGNVPFPVFVPNFPQLTTYKWLDYGKKMEAIKQETPARKNTSKNSQSRGQCREISK